MRWIPGLTPVAFAALQWTPVARSIQVPLELPLFLVLASSVFLVEPYITPCLPVLRNRC